MNIALVIIFIVALSAYLAFAVLYGTRSPWRATWQGITLLSQKVTLAALVAFFLADTIIDGHWPGRDVILLILLVLLTVEAWATVLGLIHVQRKHPPVPKRQGAGYVPPEDLERTDPRRRRK